jgi:hypothetical protein
MTTQQFHSEVTAVRSRLDNVLGSINRIEAERTTVPVDSRAIVRLRDARKR